MGPGNSRANLIGVALVPDRTGFNGAGPGRNLDFANRHLAGNSSPPLSRPSAAMGLGHGRTNLIGVALVPDRTCLKRLLGMGKAGGRQGGNKDQGKGSKMGHRNKPHSGLVHCADLTLRAWVLRALRGNSPYFTRPCQSVGFTCINRMTSAISGPFWRPVTAWRNGMNRPLPLRPVASFTADVQLPQVVSS